MLILVIKGLKGAVPRPPSAQKLLLVTLGAINYRLHPLHDLVVKRGGFQLPLTVWCTAVLISPNKNETALSLAAILLAMRLCACVRYWPYRGLGAVYSLSFGLDDQKRIGYQV